MTSARNQLAAALTSALTSALRRVLRPLQRPELPATPRLTLVLPVLACVAALALALAARHWLIEPAHLTAQCDGGARDFWCAVRFWVIQTFVHQRIGWCALGLAAFASVVPSRGAALATAALALFAASAALVLYTAELGAPAALIAALVFVPPGHKESAASSASVAQKPSA